MPLRETSVFFDWTSHRTFGPVAVNTFAALARHVEPATPGRNNLQASRRTAASPEPHATNARSPDCGIEVVDRLPVHWYLTRTTGAAAAGQWAEIKLVFPALEIAEPRTASPESSDAHIAATSSTSAAPVCVRFELTGHADVHFVRLTQLRRGIAGTFELVVLTQDCKLVAVRFTIPHSNDLSAFKHHVAWTTIHEFLDTEQFPLAVAYYHGTVFVHTEKAAINPVKLSVQWEPTASASGKSIRGKVQYKVDKFKLSVTSTVQHLFSGYVVLSMQMLWLHGRVPYLAMLTTKELIFWDPITYNELTLLAVPPRTVQMRLDGSFARLLLRTEGDGRPEYHLYELGDIVESLALAVTPVGVQMSDGLPVPAPVPGADNLRVAQFVDVAWLDPDTLVAVHGSLTKTYLHVCRTSDGQNAAWTEMDQEPSPEPDALLQMTLRNFCHEFGVPVDQTRDLTVEGVADDYVRSATSLYPPLTASTGSVARTLPPQQQHRNRTHVELYVSKALGSYKKALALKRIEVPDGDVVAHNQDMVQGPLLLIKAGGYSLLRSTLPIENVVMASLSTPFQTLANVAVTAARDLPLADWLLNDTMDEAALAVARGKATTAPETKRIQRAIDDVRKDPRLLMRDVEHVIDMLRFHVAADSDASMGDLTLHMPDLVCPLLQQVLAGTQKVVQPVLALIMLFSDMFPNQVSTILAHLRHLYVLPHLLSPKVLALLPVQVDMPLARDQDVWVMHQLANLAANFESWSWEVCAKFAGLAPADAVRAIVGRPSGRSEAMAKRWFLHGMAQLIHAQAHGGARAADGLAALHEAVTTMRALAQDAPVALDAVDLDMVHRTARILESSGLHSAAIAMYATELHLIEERFAVVAHAHVDDVTAAREAVHQRIDLVLDTLVACQLHVGDKAAAMSTIELVAKRTGAEHARTHALVRLWVQNMADNDVDLVKNALSDVVEDVLLAQADAAVAALQRDAAAVVAGADASVGGSPAHSMRRIGRGAAAPRVAAAAPVSVARQLDQVVRVHQLLGTFYLHQRREYADAATYFYLVALYARVFAAGEDADVVNLRLASLLKALHSLHMIDTKNERFVLVPGEKVPGQ
ncbi:hypothetical protein GGF32_004757, partial [Allomyces javanicus]